MIAIILKDIPKKNSNNKLILVGSRTFSYSRSLYFLTFL